MNKQYYKRSACYEPKKINKIPEGKAIESIKINGKKLLIKLFFVQKNLKCQIIIEFILIQQLD